VNDLLKLAIEGHAGADQNLAGPDPAIIGYVSRAALRHDLAERSGGRLRLN
jgi:hypothetical protein